MKKCYIAGKITGTDDFRERFEAAEGEVVTMGMKPVNPVSLPHLHNKEWQSYLRECIVALGGCEAIFMLKGWAHSQGAILEYNIACGLEMEIYFE